MFWIFWLFIYRRSRDEIPARQEDLQNAEKEDITYKFLASATRLIGDEQGRFKGIELVTMELGEPDEFGRRKPRPVEGSEFIMNVDTVIVAIGRSPNPIIQKATEGLKTTKQGTIVVDPEIGRTSLEGVYAVENIATVEATVISAMGSGRRSAKAIHEYLLSEDRKTIPTIRLLSK